MKKIITLFALVLSAQSQAQIITTILGNGTSGYTGDNGPATAAQTYGPRGITKDAAGNVYISEFNIHYIRKINPAGVVSLFAGVPTYIPTGSYSGDGGPATAARFYHPRGLAVDKDGNVYIADAENYRVRKVDAAGIITTVAGTGSTAISGDGGPATAAGLGHPSGLCFDKAGNLYIGGNTRVRKVTPTGIISTFAGNGIDSYSGDGGPATAAGVGVADIKADEAGNIYTLSGSAARKINTAGIITTIAGGATGGYSGDGGPATAAKIQAGFGIFPDKCSNVYICDADNQRLRMINTHGIITTVAGNGTAANSGDGGPAKAAQLYSPYTMYIDNNSNIYLTVSGALRYIKMDSCKNVLASPSFDKGSGQAEVRLYPNPNTGVFTLRIASGIVTDAAVTITDMMGRVVKQLNTTTNKDTDIAIQVPAGMYAVQVMTERERYVQRVIVE